MSLLVNYYRRGIDLPCVKFPLAVAKLAQCPLLSSRWREISCPPVKFPRSSAARTIIHCHNYFTSANMRIFPKGIHLLRALYHHPPEPRLQTRKPFVSPHPASCKLNTSLGRKHEVGQLLSGELYNVKSGCIL